MYIDNVPDGLILLDKDGNFIKYLKDYNNAHVCIILNSDSIKDSTIVAKYANNIMPNYLPRNNGIYVLVQDPEFDWLNWHDITSSIRAMILSDFINYSDTK